MTDELVEVTSVDSDHPANGAAAAAFLAAGIGAAVFGFIVVLSEASERVASTLTLIVDVGALSGKAAVAMFVWLSAWAILHKLLAPGHVNTRITNTVSIILIVIGFLLTFPPVFTLFGD